MCFPYKTEYPKSSEEVVRSTEAGVTGDCELFNMGCWKLSLSPL